MRIQYRLATLFLPIVFCAALCRIFFVQPSVPRLFTQPDFDTTDLIDAVNHYVRLGEARSTNQLKELAENHQSTEFNVRERIRCLDADFWQAPNERFLGRLFANVVGAGSSQVSRGEAICGLS